MKEANIMRLCQLAACECGAVIWRNNRGMFLTLDGKRKVRAGIEADGSSDLIGIFDGRFLAIEVKTATGRVSKDQQRFIRAVNASGGIAFVAYSPDDVRRELCKIRNTGMRK